MPPVHQRLHKPLVIRRGLACIKSRILRYLKLRLIDITILIPDGRHVPRVFLVEIRTLQHGYDVGAQLEQTLVVTGGEEVDAALTEETYLVEKLVLLQKFFQRVYPHCQHEYVLELLVNKLVLLDSPD